MFTLINGETLRQAIISGANNISSIKARINDLNIFPVPDGDTGTNMTMTVMSAVNEAMKLSGDADMHAVCKAIATGSLKGARGNSGVILSQFLRGFSMVAGENEELDVKLVAAGFRRAADTAYKAVMKPKEGTILTVARGIAEKTSELAADDSISAGEFANEVLKYAEHVLSNTPELLPVLKEAGVVDSGGQGLVEFVRGAADYVNGRKRVNYASDISGQEKMTAEPKPGVLESADIKFAYCTEFILESKSSFTDEQEAKLKSFLNSIGDSIVCVAMDKTVKVHVHTNHPGTVFEEALKLGELTSLKVDNMRKEHNERLFKNEKEEPRLIRTEERKKKFGFAVVATGEGLKEIFVGLGADAVISGGQTMNPSTEDLLEECRKINAETVFLFPNNKNIILAAKQAAQMSEDRKIIVIPSKTIPQGISSMIGFIEEYSTEENERTMTELLSTVKTGEVTFAVRDTEIDGKMISEGDIIAIDDNGIAAVGKAIDTTTAELIENMVDEESSVVTIYYGNGLDEAQAKGLSEKISSKYPDLEVELNDGGQNLYYYIVSVE